MNDQIRIILFQKFNPVIHQLLFLRQLLSLMSDDEIMGINIPTGFSLVYELDENLKAKKKSIKPQKQLLDRFLKKVA